MMKLHIWLCLMAFSWQTLLAQDSSLLQLSEQYAVEYMENASTQAVLYSGNGQKPVLQDLLNHQYFMEKEYINGRLSYNGIVYPAVSLRWDLSRDELIILSPANYNIVLNNEILNFFEIYDYHIFYLHPDGLADCPPAGNYIRLFSSNDFHLFEKLTKTMYRDETLNKNRYSYYFELTTIFYLLKNETYYKISSRKTLLKTLETHRKELRKFINAHNLSYKRDAEKMVLEVVKEHEKLSCHE